MLGAKPAGLQRALLCAGLVPMWDLGGISTVFPAFVSILSIICYLANWQP